MERVRIGNKTYKIRKSSPADIIINTVLPVLGLTALLVMSGILTSWDLGLL